MRTPYASEREICVQKFGNAYQRNGETDSKAPLPPSNDSAKYWNVRKRFALSFHNTRVPNVIVGLMCSLRRVETEPRFLRTLYASLPWFCVQLDFYAYCTQKFALRRPLQAAREIWNWSLLDYAPRGVYVAFNSCFGTGGNYERQDHNDQRRAWRKTRNRYIPIQHQQHNTHNISYSIAISIYQRSSSSSWSLSPSLLPL